MRIPLRFMLWYLALSALMAVACQPGRQENPHQALAVPVSAAQVAQVTVAAPDPTVIHVFVALCDNVHQGIVPVPARLGNGQDPAGNLYWGAGYGVKTFFRRDKQWNLHETLLQPRKHVIERSIFLHASGDYVLVADAYDGEFIRNTIEDLLAATAGQGADSVAVEGKWLAIGPAASLLAYIGHNGLMDFSVKKPIPAPDLPPKDMILLSCYSKAYFAEMIQGTNTRPLIWTTHLMAPEAYTLAAAIDGWMAGESDTAIQQRAAGAYHHYQQCGLKAASRLLVTGW